MTLLYSTLSGPEDVPALDASELLGIAQGLPRWDALIIVAENDNYPRRHVTWHEGHGFIVHCFEDGESWGFFLTEAASVSSPEVEVDMGGQALAKWPRQLFVDSERALEALELLLEDRKTKRNAALGPNRRISSRDRLGKHERIARCGKRGSDHDDDLAFRFARRSGLDASVAYAGMST